MPFWALTVLFLWRGVTENQYSDWFWFGLFSALGFLSKYLFIYLGLAIDIYLIYLIYTKKIDFKCILSLVPFFIVLLPHLIWLTENDYITITYGLHRTGGGDQSILDHIIHPIIFLGKQIGILIPFLLMIFLLISKIKTKISFKDDKLLFLLAINIIPMALVLLTSIIMGVKIRTMWMTPFYLFFGVLAIYIFQSQINLNKLKSFATVFIILFIFSPFAYAYVSITQTDKRTDYQGKKFAEEVQKIWNKKYNTDIKFVYGDEWIAGNLSYHLKSRPEWNGEVKCCKVSDGVNAMNLNDRK